MSEIVELDPDCRAWLASRDGVSGVQSVEEMREMTRHYNALARARLRPSLTPPAIADELISGPAGPLPVRVMRPAITGPGPTVVYFHGGGWVVGDLDSHLGQAGRLCVEAGAVVVSVGYRLAPEDRFPAAFDDAVAATNWAKENVHRLGGDSAAVVVAGDSAGGQLAASVAIAARDAGLRLAAQLLLYPVIDASHNYADAATNANYPSRARNANGPGLTLAGMAVFTGMYIDPQDSQDWRVSPINVADRRSLAPAVVHTAGLDLLSSEGTRYAQALATAGVRVIARTYPAFHHGYFSLGGVSPAVDLAATQAASDLRDVLGLPPLATLPSR